MRSSRVFQWIGLLVVVQLLMLTAPAGALGPAASLAAASTPGTATPASSTTPVSGATSATATAAASPAPKPTGTPPPGAASPAANAGSGGPKPAPTASLRARRLPVPRRLRALGLTPDTASPVSNIVLSQGGNIRVTKLGSDTSCYAGTFGLNAPRRRDIWTDYGDYPEGNPPYVSPIKVGDYADLGDFAGNTALQFFINPYTPGAVCADQEEYSDDTNSAVIYQTGPDAWVIFWEDHHDAPDIDYNDLIVAVERTPGDQLALPLGRFLVPSHER